MKQFITFCSAICFGTFAFAQTVLMGQHALDENRYDGQENDPYLFKEFASGIATNTEKGESVEYLINYNGHTNEFEFIHGGVTSELDASYYDVIEIGDYTPSESYSDKYSSASLKFVKGVNSKAPKSFGIVLYEDEEVVLYKDFSARLATRELNDPARGIVKIESFVHTFQYHVKSGAETKGIGLNKKKVVAALSHDDVASYLKKNKLKVKTEEELIDVVEYYADLRAADAASTLPIASSN